MLFPSINFGAIVMQGVYYTLASIRQGCLIQAYKHIGGAFIRKEDINKMI